MRRQGTPVSREALYEEVWTDAVTPSHFADLRVDRTPTLHVARHFPAEIRT